MRLLAPVPQLLNCNSVEHNWWVILMEGKSDQYLRQKPRFLPNGNITFIPLFAQTSLVSSRNVCTYFLGAFLPLANAVLLHPAKHGSLKQRLVRPDSWLLCSQAPEKSFDLELEGPLASGKCCSLTKPERLLSPFFFTLR